MKVDLHTHTAEHSDCGQSDAIDMVTMARLRGLDGVAVTDHWHHLSAADRDRLQRGGGPIRVFRGAEIAVREQPGAEFEDVLVITDVPCPELYAPGPDHPGRVAEFAMQTGALTILAHPFRYQDGIAFDLGRFCPDAVEIASQNVDPRGHDRIVALAERWGMRLVAASDAHHTREVGLFYVELDEAAGSEIELAQAIRSGAFALGSHRPTLQRREGLVTEQEELARRVLAAGGTVGDFLAVGGQGAGLFHRVAAGGSSMPNARAIGLRNGAHDGRRPRPCAIGG